MLLQHVAKAVVPPSTLRAGLSPALDEVILRALAKDPRSRTATAEDFRRGLMFARRQMRQKPRSIVALVETECGTPKRGVVSLDDARDTEEEKDVEPQSGVVVRERTDGDVSLVHHREGSRCVEVCASAQ
jgi:hypothetical protein